LLLWSLSSPGQTPPVQANVQKAEQAFDAGRYAEALELFQRAEAESPRCELYFFIGLTQYRLQHLEDAIANFASSVACNPRFTLAQRALGDAYGTKGDDNRALAAYEAALKIQPNDPETLRAASLLCLKHELSTRALPLLERYVKLQPKDAEARADLGAVYAGTGQFDKAEGQFRLALTSNPESPAAVLGLGALELKTSRTEQALPLLSKAAKLAPDAAKPLYLLGSAYNRLGRYREAAAVLEKAASRSPDDAEIYYQLAHAYGHLQKAGERQKAMERFVEIKKKGEELFHAQREAVRLLGEVQPLVDRGDLAAALQMMERAYALDPHNEDAMFRLAGLYYDAQKYDLAREYAGRVAERAPSEWRYQYLLGMAQMATGQWQQAQVSFEQVVRLNPGMAEAYNELGNLAMKETKPAEAVKAFEQAVRTDPQKSVYKENLEAARKAAAEKN
jgi:tetratricopeptide (TPR) repeat protein